MEGFGLTGRRRMRSCCGGRDRADQYVVMLLIAAHPEGDVRGRPPTVPWYPPGGPCSPHHRQQGAGRYTQGQGCTDVEGGGLASGDAPVMSYSASRLGS